MTEGIKVYQDEGKCLESNVSGFIRDFWSYESGNIFSDQPDLYNFPHISFKYIYPYIS